MFLCFVVALCGSVITRLLLPDNIEAKNGGSSSDSKASLSDSETNPLTRQTDSIELSAGRRTNVLLPGVKMKGNALVTDSF